jgi:uncharacterized protein YndB with AHSA1/START domain
MMQITVQTNINSSLAQVWECWTLPEHIINWNFASDDWCCPSATNGFDKSVHLTCQLNQGQSQA